MSKIQALKKYSLLILGLLFFSVLDSAYAGPKNLYSFKGIVIENSAHKAEFIILQNSLSEAILVVPEYMQNTLQRYLNDSIEIISPAEQVSPQKWNLFFDPKETKIYPTVIDFTTKGVTPL
jgi:hypothetical protein